MKPIKVRELTQNEIDELQTLYDITKDVRMRTRAQIVLLSVEHNMTAQQIGQIVRKNDQTVRRWIKRYNAGGINGLFDAPRPGAPEKVTPEYCELLLSIVHQRPSELEQPYSKWTLAHLADFMAEKTGIRVSVVTVRRVLKGGGVVLSRPQKFLNCVDSENKVKKHG
jgi:transposase